MSSLEELFNVETEKATLGGLLINPSAVETTQFLRSEDFRLEIHNWIHEAILHLHHGGQSIDTLSICNELDRNARLARCGGAAYLAELMTWVPSALHVVTYAEEIVDLSTRRQILQRLSGIAAQLHKNVSVDEVVTDAVQSITHAYRSRGEFHAASQIARGVRKTVKYWHENPEPDGIRGIRTGLARLDASTGGLNPNELTVVAARPGVGKSALMGWIAMCIAQQEGPRVLLWSGEMTDEQVVMRMACGLAKISLQRLKRGSLSAAERDAIKEAIESIKQLDNLLISDTASLTMAGLRAEAASLGNPDVVMADHLGLMGDRDDNEVRRLGTISWGLKQLAKQGCAVVTACQLSRRSEYRTDKRPQLADLRNSGHIEENADNVWGLYREGLNGHGAVSVNTLEINTLKNRNGPTNHQAKVYFNPEFMRLGNLERGT